MPHELNAKTPARPIARQPGRASAPKPGTRFAEPVHVPFDFAKLLAAASGPSHVPLYKKLTSALQTAIQSGALRTGDGIPPERDLAVQLGVSRITVRRALKDLAGQGLLFARQGSGTAVAARVEQPLSDLGSFSDDITRRGLTPGSRWISRELVYPSPDEIIALGLAITDQVIRMERVRTANGAPIAVERATVKADLLGGKVEFGNSLYEALRRQGVVPYRALQRLRAEVVHGKDARLLGLGDGDAVLSTERRSFTADGHPVEFTRAVYRGDRYDYLVELRTTGTREQAPELHSHPRNTP